MARTRSITYADAVRRAFCRREAFATARPYSVLVLGYGNACLYQCGVLCYISHENIRILNVHNASETEHVIHFPTLISHALGGAGGNSSGELTLLNYSDRILACSYETGSDAWLIAVDVGPRRATPRRIRAVVLLETTEKLFVRHDTEYLYYGTHSGLASHGHHEWIIKGLKMRVPSAGTVNTVVQTSEHDLQLSNLVGSDMGCTVTFEIHQGYFYALSNQTSFDVEEVDWTSYYHCLRFSLGEQRKDRIEVDREIWRRQHIEGPINDSWTDLGLRSDEGSGKLLIVECRREWKGGGSQSQRTFYTQSITFPAPSEIQSATDQQSPLSETGSARTPLIRQALPADDPLTSTIDENNKPHWAPPKIRLPREEHREEQAEGEPRGTFTLSKTKYRTYNPSCASFLDIVLDDRPTQSPCSRLARPQVRLRIGSRKPASPLNDDGTLRTPDLDLESGKPIPGSEDRFTDRGIRMWPPDDAPAELLEILNPSTDLRDLQGWSDERSVLYTVPAASAPGPKAIVLINFDPALEHANLPFLDSKMSRPSRQSGKSNDVCGVLLEPRRFVECRSRGVCMPPGSRPGAGAGSAGSAVPWFQAEQAMHRRMGKGFRLR